MSSPQLEVLLSRLANVKRSGKHYMASCPAHGGHDCLTVTDTDDGRVLVHCFAGCSAREVVESVDLRLSDLFPDSLNKEKRREYEIRSAKSAIQHARLIEEIASNQARESNLSNDDLETLRLALERRKAAEAQLEQLGEIDGEDEPTENRFLSRLSFDADSALDELANQQWIIDQVLPMDGFGVLYGASGTYKSFLALSLAAAVSTGGRWFGNDVDNAGQVIYIAAEGAAGLQARKKAYEIRHGVKLSKLGILADSPIINKGIDCEMLVQACLAVAEEFATPIRLIVVDTLARAFAGEENSASDMGEFIRACDYIRRTTGASIMVIHHSGKDLEKGARGSSALRAACDFEFKVSALGKKHTKLACTKAKDVDPFDDLEFKLDPVELGRNDAKGRKMISLVPRLIATHSPSESDDPEPERLSSNQEKLNDLVSSIMAKRGQDFVTQTFLLYEWKHIVGGNPASAKTVFFRTLSELISKGWLVKDSEGLVRRSEKF